MSALVVPAGQRRWRRWRKQAPNYLFVLPHFLFFLVFLAGPVVFGFWISFHDWEILSPEKPFVQLANYQDLLADPLFFRTVQNTVVFTVLTVVAEAVLGLALALLVNESFPGRLGVRITLFAPRVLSVATMGIIWQWMMNKDWGFLNYLTSLAGLPRLNWLGDPVLVLPSLAGATTWWVVGFAMIVYLAGLQNIPEEYYEAAKIDGANSWHRFRHVTLPLLMPTTLFVLVTAFIGQMQVFGQVYLMTQGGPYYASMSIVFYLYDNGFRYFRMGYAAAMAFSLAAIILVVTLAQFRLLGRRVEY
ncbi:MAG TPA: sugar ABC transporter permease [Chloroflexota bacterium]|nr:sugar ABC transporter permease [Chloroflexota bacterium]